ncbi:protein FAM210A-like [Sycon ciliatum]|uniref:protein FAM210A-like n=1 Tax=Sycon ciliatum TaxID=27933 RepID=UPI0031F6A88B
MSLIRHVTLRGSTVKSAIRPLSLMSPRAAACCCSGVIERSSTSSAGGYPRTPVPIGLSAHRYMATEPGKQVDGEGDSQSSQVSDDQSDRPAASLSRAERLKLLVAQYGSVVMVFHVSMSLTSLGLMYVAVSAGLDVVAIAAKLGVDLGVDGSGAATASTFAIAYVAHKLLAPARIAITAATVPLIVRYLRQLGYMRKPVKQPSAETQTAAAKSAEDSPPKN